MNRIILIGNGFDLAHGLKTSYSHFIDWFWGEQLNKINQIKNTNEEWELVSNSLEDTHYEHKRNDFFVVTYKGKIDFIAKEQEEKQDAQCESKDEINNVQQITKKKTEQIKTEQQPKFEDIDDLKNNVVYKNKFLEIIEKRRKSLNNWVDIEELYFQILTNCKNRVKDENVYEIYTVEQLNRDFRAIKLQLESFIKTRNDVVSNNTDYITALKQNLYTGKQENRKNKTFFQTITDIIKNGIDSSSKVLLLNFNFSNTVSELYDNKIDGVKTTLIPIHGEASKPNDNSMIVGYGDEVADDSVEIEKLNNNAFLENVKSIKYVETCNYSDFLNFIETKDNKGKYIEYDVFVFGHSCGNSDRTLLKALFERENCKEIKCFYYKITEKEDDFNAIVDNIYRKFEDKTIFRKKICIKDKKDGAFPQYNDYGVESPFKQIIIEDAKPVSVETTAKNELPVAATNTQTHIELFNMVQVEFDVNAIAYTNISDNITSKKRLKNNFYIGKYQVTQKEWQDIMGDNPSWFSENGGGKKAVTSIDTDNLPVESVSWYDCVSFCNKLSEKYDLSKYYNINGEDITTNEDAKGFRLPTETEWEYAARGGKEETQKYEYAGSNNVKEVAWYYENSGNNDLKQRNWDYEKAVENNCRTHKVGEKNENKLKLHDMSGNVWEWCEDWYDNKTRADRVLRGGGWDGYAEDCRVSFRCINSPVYRNFNFGFRLVLPQLNS